MKVGLLVFVWLLLVCQSPVFVRILLDLWRIWCLLMILLLRFRVLVFQPEVLCLMRFLEFVVEVRGSMLWLVDLLGFVGLGDICIDVASGAERWRLFFSVPRPLQTV